MEQFENKKVGFIEDLKSIFIGMTPLSLFGLILFYGLFGSKNNLVVSVSGIGILMTLGYSFFKSKRRKKTNSEVNKTIWWLMLLVIAIVVGEMYLKLFGVK